MFSFEVEHARGHTFNLAVVPMKHHNLDFQGTIDNAMDVLHGYQFIPRKQIRASFVGARR